MTLTPNSPVFRSQMRNYSALLNCSTVIFMGDWGEEGLQLIADGVLKEKESKAYVDGAEAEKGLTLSQPETIK